MQLKLAILCVLAMRPDGHARFGELRDEVETFTANDDRPDKFSTLDDIDIFQSGLVIPEGDGLRITDAGRSALKALEGSNELRFDLPTRSPSPSLKMIDHLIGTEERLKIFDLDPRGADIDPALNSAEEVKDAQNIENTASVDTTPVAAQEPDGDLPRDSMAFPTPEIAELQSSEPDVVARKGPEWPDTPAFFARNFVAEAETPAWAPPCLASQHFPITIKASILSPPSEVA